MSKPHSFPENLAKAERAAGLLSTYSLATGQEADAALLDLIADLGHLADRDGLDFGRAVTDGIAYWLRERSNPHQGGPLPIIELWLR